MSEMSEMSASIEKEDPFEAVASVLFGVPVDPYSLCIAFNRSEVHWLPVMEVFREVNARRSQHKGQAWLPEEILIKIQECLKHECTIAAVRWSFASPFRRGILDTEMAIQAIEGPIARHLKRYYGVTCRPGFIGETVPPDLPAAWICVPWKTMAPTPLYGHENNVWQDWRTRFYNLQACLIGQDLNATPDHTLAMNKAIMDLQLVVSIFPEYHGRQTHVDTTNGNTEIRTGWPCCEHDKHGKLWIPQLVWVNNAANTSPQWLYSRFTNEKILNMNQAIDEVRRGSLQTSHTIEPNSRCVVEIKQDDFEE